MSLIKKGVKAIGKTVGKAVKGVANFVADHWKPLVLVGLSVFTMGMATVGFTGFSGAMSAANGGFGGFMSAVGSTMYAGVTALGGTLGLTSGAAGTAAAQGGVPGVGLFGGRLAAALGSKTAQAGIASQLPGQAVTNAAGVTATGIGAAPTSVNGPYSPGIGAPTTSGLSGLGQAALIATAGNAVAGYATAKAAEPPRERGFWGVDVRNRNDRSADVPFTDPRVTQPSQFTPAAPAGPPAPAAPSIPASAATPAGVNVPVTGAPLTPQQQYELQLLGMARNNGLMSMPWAAPQGV